MALSELLRKILPERNRAPKRQSFDELARSFAERLKEWDRPASSKEGACVGVLVTPWLKTAVPFFALECALALRDAGCRVRVLWDATDLVGNADNASEIEAVRSVFDALPRDVEIVAVVGLPAADHALDDDLAAAIVRENAVWKMRGETSAQQFIDERPAMQPAVRAHLAKVLALLEREALDWVLIPGGIYGVSAAYLAAAKRLGRQFSVFDSGAGVLLLAHSGIAAHHCDTPVAIELFETQASDREIAFALREGQRELEHRISGTDENTYQLAPATGAKLGDANVLIPLNLRWDAAALSRLRLFDSVEHWLTSLLDWAARTPEARLCIRQHPVERHSHTRSVDDIAGLLARYAYLGARIRFVSAAEPVNSYDLMRSAKVVLPFTSSAGIEAAMLGLPVVLGTHCYYERLPFVARAESVEEYFALIGRALDDGLEVSAAAKRSATLTYYFTQRCAYLRTKFTPVPDDFRAWCATPPVELWAQPELADLRETLLDRKPIGFVQHRRFFRDAQPQ